jgi:15-cis-phytoene synthase
VNKEQEIFKNGSTTYYWSSKFFPEHTRADVFKLYSFVRIADDFIDAKPQDVKKFRQLEKAWLNVANSNKLPNNRTNPDIKLAVTNMHELYLKYEFDKKWIDAFLESMNMDINPKPYKTLNQTLKYIYGSAEVIGLMMSKIIGVPPKGYEAAKLQGRAMQYINFIRDIKEDIELGRQYFPARELSKYGLPSLGVNDIVNHPAAFREFIEGQIDYYNQWQKEAAKGFKYIPRSQRVALRTAVDMYNWTANTIAKNPFIVLDKKIKPSKLRVVARALIRTIHA